MTAHLYARVSTTQQTEGFSLQTQKERMQAYCTYQGIYKTQHWEDAGISGRRDDRPALTAMLHSLQKDDQVIVYSLSRLGRGGAIQTLKIVEQIQSKGASLVSLTENIDTSTATGKLVLTVLAGIAELEVETTKERSVQGRITSIKLGRVPLSPFQIPFGYRKKDGQLVIEPTEAQIVRRIYQLASEPYGKRRPGAQILSEILNKEGHIAPRDGEGGWHPGSVFRLIRNTAYKGEGVYRGDSGKNTLTIPYPPIVTPELWDAAQAGKGNKHNHSDPEAFPISGLLACIHGVKVHGRWRRNRTPVPYRTYFIDSLKRKQVACDCGSLQVQAEELEAKVKAELSRMLLDPTDPMHLKSLVSSPADPNEQERRDLQAQRTNLLDMRQRGWIDLPEFENRMLQLQMQLNALSAPQSIPINTTLLASLATTLKKAKGQELRDILTAIEAKFLIRSDGSVLLLSYRPLDS